MLLDEAQDTDPRQFEVLQMVAGLGDRANQADDQTFCIVGDFQQAIYAPRSDLGRYRRMHEEISAGPRGASSRLQVTFRCDTAIIDLVNRIFPSVLTNANGQCAFVPLVARDEAGPGQTLRWLGPQEPEQAAGKRISAAVRARHEAAYVARRIKELGPAGLGASDWSQVAILCPRKSWLLEIQRELVDLDLPVQLHSSNEQQRDRTAAAWLTSLVWIAAHPEDIFEIAGVLREIFGVPDADMAMFTEGAGHRLRLDRAVPAGDGPVETALRTLRDACARTEAMPLGEAVDQLVAKTRLRERLISIEGLSLENVGHDLDDFLAVIAGRGAEGVTLAQLADELRLGLTQVNPAEEEIEDAIQLLTSHKAKGLEWQAVIVPYVFRAIESKAPTYPNLVTAADGREIVCRDRADFVSQARDFVTERERQQLQRLLYVVATRAKRTLVLVDDEALYAGQIRRGGWSAGDLLGFFGENRATWSALAETISPLTGIHAERRSPITTASEIPLLPDLLAKDVRQAMARAASFPRRTTPHALAIHARNEAEPEAQAEQEDGPASRALDGPGILYGTWWHEFIQTIPWQKPISVWQKKFSEARGQAPQPARAVREWDLFCNSELARWLATPGRIVQAELPFLWPETPLSCLEGVMDLAVLTQADGVWNVIDWKTNRVGAAGSAGLVETYRGQIEAYVRALRQMLSAEVRGSLYLTQTGEWAVVVT